MKGKLKFILPVILVLALGGGAAYRIVLAPPAKAQKAVKPKVNGSLFAAVDPFIVNLAGGHYGKLSVALLLSQAPPPGARRHGDLPVTLPEDSA